MANRAFQDLYGEDELFQVFAQTHSATPTARATQRLRSEVQEREEQEKAKAARPLLRKPVKRKPKKSRRNVEREVAAWVEGLGVSILRNDRKVIRPMELDVFAHQLGIAIEVNGSYWHSTAVTSSTKGLTAEQLHAKKLLRAAEAGVVLAYVWEDDWLLRGHLVRKALLQLFTTGVMDPLLEKLVGPLG